MAYVHGLDFLHEGAFEVEPFGRFTTVVLGKLGGFVLCVMDASVAEQGRDQKKLQIITSCLCRARTLISSRISVL